MDPSRVVMMKGGPHAGSGWTDIVAWKIGDLRNTGVTFWGYGGSVATRRGKCSRSPVRIRTG